MFKPAVNCFAEKSSPIFGGLLGNFSVSHPFHIVRSYCKMDLHQHLHKARAAHSKNAAERRASTLFILSWRGGGTAQVVGYMALAQALKVKESSIPVLFSRGSGEAFDITRANPLTGELDVCTVTRTFQAKPKPRRGRPPKHVATDVARLGTEFAESAGTMLKGTSRRRDESQ